MGTANTSAIGTLVERSTRFTILLHLPADHTAESVAAAMIAAMSELPAHLRRTITWDRGSEMANWRTIDLQLQAPVYFCDPHSPWQRGTIENTYWCTVLEPDGFDGGPSGGLLGDSENTCRIRLSVDLSTAA
jgi:IS30 family transposase